MKMISNLVHAKGKKKKNTKAIFICSLSIKIYKGKLKRSILNIYNTLKDKGDINLAFPTVISVVNNQSIKE